MISYHAHSPERQAEHLMELLDQGHDVVLVTDAGTPTISDPGAELIRAAIHRGFEVVPIPGPSAVPTALSVSGLPADRYSFVGFLPRKGRERAELIAAIAASPWTVVAFEAPGRVGALLQDLADQGVGDREVVIARELTKIHEELLRGTVTELATAVAATELRGECTVVIAGRGEIARDEPEELELARRVAALLLAAGTERRLVLQVLTEGLGQPRNASYRLVLDAS
jgi:16S rRNA (cytidine1402-2'-O)-methyltransferase